MKTERPPKRQRYTGNGKRLTVYVSPALAAQVQAQAERTNTSTSRTACKLLYLGVAEQERRNLLKLSGRAEQQARTAQLDAQAAEEAARRAAARVERARQRKRAPAPDDLQLLDPTPADAAPAAAILAPVTRGE